jgi:hypothetical protein
MDIHGSQKDKAWMRLLYLKNKNSTQKEGLKNLLEKFTDEEIYENKSQNQEKVQKPKTIKETLKLTQTKRIPSMVANSIMRFFPCDFGHVTTNIEQIKEKIVTHTQNL